MENHEELKKFAIETFKEVAKKDPAIKTGILSFLKRRTKTKNTTPQQPTSS